MSPKPSPKALRALVEANDRQQLAALLASGLDPNQRLDKGWDLLEYSVSARRPVLVKALLAGGAKVRKSGALGVAVRNRQPAMVELLLDAGTDPDFGKPLLAAVVTGQHRVVGLLLAAGANPHVRDEHGRSALHLAINHARRPERSKSVEAFIQSGADLDRPDKEGFSPLGLAFFMGKRGAGALLRAAGAKAVFPRWFLKESPDVMSQVKLWP